jgi:hypothetical protein
MRETVGSRCTQMCDADFHCHKDNADLSRQIARVTQTGFDSISLETPVLSQPVSHS